MCCLLDYKTADLRRAVLMDPRPLDAVCSVRVPQQRLAVACLSRESTVQSLDAAIRDQRWGSQKRFDGYLHIYAHDAHRPADYLSPFATTISHASVG